MRKTLTALLFLTSLAVNAENITMSGTVSQVLLDAENYGGCMVALNPQPTTQDARCSGRWITFSCTGDYNSKSEGRASYDSALAAAVLNKPITVVVDTNRKHNNYCFARLVKFSP